jgi:hypothetical protein
VAEQPLAPIWSGRYSRSFTAPRFR